MPALPINVSRATVLATLLLCAAACSPAKLTAAPEKPGTINAGTATVTKGELRLTLNGLTPGEGTVMVALYNNESDFKARKSVRRLAQKAPANATSVQLSFSDLPAGEYGVMLFQDLNGNEELDSNLMGIPNEPWGASLSGMVFGPPTWGDVKFALPPDGKQIEIKL